MSINAAHDEEFLAALAASGCRGVLIGFESLDENVLRAMNKTFNTMRGGFAAALANLRRHGIRVYGTFVFGYDGDAPTPSTRPWSSPSTTASTSRPSTTSRRSPARRCSAGSQREGRLLYERWWLDERYGYNGIPFQPIGDGAGRHPQRLPARAARFYAWRSMLRRAFDPVNRADAFMFRNFFVINGMHRVEVAKRDHFPARRPDLERTVAQGGVSGRTLVAGDLVFAVGGTRRTTPTSARLLRENATDGWIRLSLEREPDAFAAAAVMGRRHAYIIARDRGDRRGGRHVRVVGARRRSSTARCDCSPISVRCGSRRASAPPPRAQGGLRGGAPALLHHEARDRLRA